MSGECPFDMATYNRRSSDHAFQVNQDVVYRNMLEPECFPLSKSSSDTLFPRRENMEERKMTNPYLRKTISSVVSSRNTVETDTRYSCHSSCFMPQNNFTIIPLCGCFQMNSIPNPNHVTESPIFQDGAKLHANDRTNSSSDIRRNTDTMLYKDPNLGKLQTKLMCRSCSDIICGYKENCCQDNVVHSQSTMEHQVIVPDSNCSVIPQSEMTTMDSDQKIVISISESDTDNDHHETMGERPATSEHQVNSINNNVCNSMHQSHFMLTENSHNYPGVMVVQESGRQYQDNCMKGNATITKDQANVQHKEDALMNNHNCTGLQSHMIPGLSIEDTSPAFCHSLPIPAIHLMPRLISSVSDSGRGNINAYCHPLPVSGILAFPRLVSSVSESGLDTKHLLRCHGTVGNNVVPTMTDENPQNISDVIKVELENPAHPSQQNSPNNNVNVRTRDMCTMTSIRDLTLGIYYQLRHKDAEVQTSFAVDCRSVGTNPMSPMDCCLVHMFPEVNLEENQEIQESPVREVKWDDKGMTWEIYGASVDPEVLGLAIQKHLEIQIEQHEKDKVSTAEKTLKHLDPHFDATHVLEHQTKEKRHLPGFRKMFSTLRHPTCCIRSNTAID
ncbi:GRIN2-like protein isoform X1 [Hypanus sabinus]|uniref:GRIN2-like protein isoform X1 n=2 Tax=Hypanus sabinus TaxID=79690 RepID=UPI0028C4C7A1|nr:GRIN2-like protein isoform X1 [Hypanus sabinus]